MDILKTTVTVAAVAMVAVAALIVVEFDSVLTLESRIVRVQ
jgi:hypothetical protein